MNYLKLRGDRSRKMHNLADLKIYFLAGTLGQGGAERQLYYILKSLKACGATVRLLCLTQGEFWEDKILELDIPVTWVGQQESRLSRLTRLVADLARDRPDILQSQHLYTNLYSVMAARILGLKEVGGIRGNAFRETRALGIMGILSLRTPRMVAANSQATIRNAIELGVPSNRLYFLPNVLDTDQFKPATKNDNPHIQIITVGRLIPLKRIDRFLSIISRLQKETSQKLKGIIVGNGPKKEQLERQAAEMGLLPDGVEFKGSVSDVSPIYRESDIFLLTSESEGTPNVLLEAMASGLPVVATRVGDVADIIQDMKTGCLFNLEDEDSVIKALLQLIHNPEQRREMGRLARNHVENHYSLLQLPTYLDKLYSVVLS